MGRQVNFYFAKSDEEAFLTAPAMRDTVLVNLRSEGEPSPSVVVQLWERCYSDTRVLQACVTPAGFLSGIRYLSVPSIGRYLVDTDCSPVIEYSRSGLNAELNLLVSGRLWYQEKYWDRDENGNDVLMQKDPSLTKLYNTLSGWIKRHCKRLPNGLYIGPGALELYEKGASLSP